MKKHANTLSIILSSLLTHFLKKPYIILIVFAFFLTFIWFSPRNLIAGGEEGIFFYNPQLSLHLFSSTWYQVETGMPMPVFIPRATLLFIPFLLTNVFSFPAWFSQAVVLFLLVITGLISMYYLSKYLLSEQSKSPIFVLVSLFYLLNLYALSQIFGRLLFTGIVLWAYLPLFTFLYIQWVEKRKLIYLFTFLIASFLFSYTYGMPSNVIVIWIIPIIWSFFTFFQTKGKIFLLTNILLISLLWVLTNTWWTLPYVKLSSAAFSTISSNNSANLDSLIGVSAYFPTSQIVQLKQSYLFQHAYYGWYNQILVVGLSIFLSLIVMYGIFSSFRRKNWWILITLFIIGWFVSKGTNPPFGTSFYHVLFTYFPSLQLFRNSYEKFGIIFLFPYAFFFGMGIESVYKKITNNLTIRAGVWLISILIFCIGLTWPMVTGDVFGADLSNVRITAPDYYNQANRYINSMKKGRILMVPMIPGDGIVYNWSGSNYEGIEPSESLFTNPTISKIVRIDSVDKKYMDLYNAFVNHQQYNQYLSEMGIQYIILHNDINSSLSGASPAANAKEILKKNPKIQYMKSFGKLDLYKYIDPHAGEIIQVDGLQTQHFSYKKISTTHYLVSIDNANAPYTLILKETFNPLWQASINNSILMDHHIIYNYANEWEINRKGKYTINIILKIWPWQ